MIDAKHREEVSTTFVKLFPAMLALEKNLDLVEVKNGFRYWREDAIISTCVDAGKVLQELNDVAFISPMVRTLKSCSNSEEQAKIRGIHIRLMQAYMRGTLGNAFQKAKNEVVFRNDDVREGFNMAFSFMKVELERTRVTP